MGFNIPMSTAGAFDSSSLLNLNGGSGANNGQAGQMDTMGGNPNQSMGQPQPQQSYQTQANQYQQVQSQPQPQQNYQQTQNNQYQQGYSQPQQTQQGMSSQAPQGKGVHLKKGQKFNIAGAGGSQLQTIKLGLGWDVKNQACDLDASAFMLDSNNKILNGDESWFVFYGQLISPDGSVKHSGDSGGEGYGDDETITVNLNQVNPQVQRIAFVVTINEAIERNLNFSMVANAYVRIIDAATNTEIARFELSEYYSTVTAMVVGELYRHNGAWKFNPVGDGVAKDLAGLCGFYGVAVAD